MAHIGEKLAFGPVRDIGDLFREAQFAGEFGILLGACFQQLLGLFELRDTGLKIALRLA